MTDPKPQPLRGDAAWRAQKNEISKRNDAAQERGAAQRAARRAKVVEQQRAAARLDLSNLPEQPQP